MPDENQTASDEILIVRRVSRDTDGSYIVRCPHCQKIIGIEGDDLSEVRGEQFQHRVLIFDGSYHGCNGWLEVDNAAAFVRELPQA